MYEAVFEENCGLVWLVAQRYARFCELDPAVTFDDLLQTGFVGLANAADTYSPDCGKSWAGWALWKIDREVGRFLGVRRGYAEKAHLGAVPLDQPIPGEDGDTLLDRLPDRNQPGADAVLQNRELRQALLAAMARLKNGDQRRVARLCQLEGLGYGETARRLGLSVDRTRRLWHQAAAHLARDEGLRRAAALDERTRFHAHKGVAAFNRDWTSVTEAAALWRVRQRERG